MSNSENYQRMLTRLRALRLKQGHTLRSLERDSKGRWKAVVVGSYERGARKISLEKAAQLCELYGAEISALATSSLNPRNSQRLLIDLRRLRLFNIDSDRFATELTKLASWIIAHRGDWNGSVLSLRSQDIHTLEVALDMDSAEILAALELRSLILKGVNRP